MGKSPRMMYFKSILFKNDAQLDLKGSIMDNVKLPGFFDFAFTFHFVSRLVHKQV